VFESWFRAVAKARWLVVVLWVVAAAALFAGTRAGIFPDLRQIVKETETKFIPDDAESVQASQLANAIDPDHRSQSNAVIVLHREEGLRDADREWLKRKLEVLDQNRSAYEIVALTSPFDPDYSAKLESEDRTTLLAVIHFAKSEFTASTQESIERIREELTDVPDGTAARLTGSAPINLDFQRSSEEGIKKTEILTVVLVLAILLIVFRSPVAPLVPLATVALSFLIARTAVAALTEFGLPVSSFTESFLIAVLFGAGTDYCILIIQRYREELGKGIERVDALVKTMRTVGKTVVFSASTVLIAFFLIGFAQFGLYQSAVGVSIGMLATLAAALTLAPALLVILGPAAFWPVRIKPGQGHGESRTWAKMAAAVSRRPAIVALVAVIVLSPLVVLYQGSRSFDELAEIDPNFDSVAGFRTIKDKFGAGESMPVTITIASSQSMRTPEALAAIERASEALAGLDNVAEVRSATRPAGERLTDLTVSNQLEKTSDGLEQVRSGVAQVADGLNKAREEMRQSAGRLDELNAGLVQMAEGARKAEKGLKQVQSGLGETERGLAGASDGARQTGQVAASMADDLNQLAAAHPELANDPAFRTIAAKQQAVTESLSQLEGGLGRLRQGAAALAPAVGEIAQGLARLADSQTEAANGVSQFKDGLSQLDSGLNQSAQALSQAADGLAQIRDTERRIAEESGKQIDGWHIPREALDNDEFKKALDLYMSPDGKIAKLEVVLAVNPYSREALETIDPLRDTVKQSLAGSAIRDADVKLTGTTAQFVEVDRLSSGDFRRTGLFVVIGIGIVLIVLLRSVAAPVYILLSLAFNYFVAMGLVEFTFVRLFGHPGLSWNTAFFVFLVLVALGVDYSIFLMARFKEEYRQGEAVNAMKKAMATTGSVIVSAALIMGGTFATFLYSGVNTLVQIGTGVVIGLFLYTAVFMGLVVPAITMLFGEANWWPFRRVRAVAAAEQPPHAVADG
jgi:RND superfamily putative drug exporter